MQVYGLYYQDIYWTLVCLFKSQPSKDDLYKALEPRMNAEWLEETVQEIIEGGGSDYRIKLVDVIQNGEV